MKWMRELSVKQAMMGKPEEIPHHGNKKEKKPARNAVSAWPGEKLSFFPLLDFLIKFSAFDGKEELKCPWTEGSIGNRALLSLNH